MCCSPGSRAALFCTLSGPLKDMPSGAVVMSGRFSRAEFSEMNMKYGGRKLTCTQCATMEEVLAGSDVVSLHTLLDEKTRHMIDAKALATMKPG